MKKFLIPLLFFRFLFAAEGDYKFEGLYSDDGDRRFFLIAYYLPYNPSIVGFSPDPSMARRCEKWWPSGNFSPLDVFSSPDPSRPCDFLWIECTGGEEELLERHAPLLAKSRVLYTTTHLEQGGESYRRLKHFLEAMGFKLLSHWFWEGKSGQAIFVQTDMLEIALRTLNFPTPNTWPSRPSPIDLKPYLKKAEGKPGRSSFEEIDFIYMINLDERPDKFLRTSFELQLYGIDPYRFSAVNGWMLTPAVLDQLGVQFSPGSLTDRFMGTRFVGKGSSVFPTNEYLAETKETFFTIGMSRGAIGIVLSHLSILQDALDAGYRTIWVMEDDVEVVSEPARIPSLIRELDQLAPDWDILFTDTDTKGSDGRHVPCRAIAARPNFQAEPLSRFFEKFYALSGNLNRTGMRYGAYSMILRRSAMEKILSFYQNFRIYLPYDLDYWLIPTLKMYAPASDIVSHKTGSASDNSFPNYLDQ